jgi:hypothetical protein
VYEHGVYHLDDLPLPRSKCWPSQWLSTAPNPGCSPWANFIKFRMFHASEMVTFTHILPRNRGIQHVFFYRFIISSQCKKIQLWYNQSSLYWPVLGVFSIGIFSWWRRGIPLWIPRGSPSRQGLFTSEQKADPTPRLFVPLSHSARAWISVDGLPGSPGSPQTRRRMARERRGAGSSLVSMETQFYKQYMKDVL